MIIDDRLIEMDYTLVPCAFTLFPVLYLVYVFIHAALRGFDSSIMNYAGTDPIIYPYFFLNPERVGIAGMITWILALLVGFIVMGYIFMIIDHLLGRRA